MYDYAVTAKFLTKLLAKWIYVKSARVIEHTETAFYFAPVFVPCIKRGRSIQNQCCASENVIRIVTIATVAKERLLGRARAFQGDIMSSQWRFDGF